MEKNKICLSEIKELIPHREPFLYIEELNNIQKLYRATGINTFRDKDSFFAFLATNKIHFKYNGKIYVGNAHGMEFTTPGPLEHTIKEGRR